MDKININNLFVGANAGKSGEINIKNIFDTNDNYSSSSVKVNIDKMISMKEEKKRKAREQYSKIYGICTNKINDAISVGNSELIFDIPYKVPFVIEYSNVECMEYINEKLKDIDMDTILVSDVSIFISWRFIEENMKAKKSKSK